MPTIIASTTIFTEIITLLTEIIETMLISIMVYTKAGEQEEWVQHQGDLHNLDHGKI